MGQSLPKATFPIHGSVASLPIIYSHKKQILRATVVMPSRSKVEAALAEIPHGTSPFTMTTESSLGAMIVATNLIALKEGC
ncbi:hypothetical protein N7539_000906 [Penicillium diatomitis]|uniref:Uncharacterized protein n=1 Tax=Penicillium diatomitis TaxID=2819901 RepID=A0A9X0C337_9EURO|nr:uncharacterized protein N7539_000906 [Penicillium diatomitis]KAJ5495790.1 hypothetical protein N7539_000906 [Penicillium diatomitis]